MERRKTTIRIVFIFCVQFEMYPYSPSTSMSEVPFQASKYEQGRRLVTVAINKSGGRKWRDVANRPLLVVYPYDQELV